MVQAHKETLAYIFTRVSSFHLSKPDTGIHSSFNVSEHRLKLIYMHLLYPKEYLEFHRRHTEDFMGLF